MENRIDQKFATLKKQGQKAFIAYITAGDPHIDRTSEIALSLEKAGVDLVELGIPYSDPLADGPVIQQSSQRALDSGTNLKSIFSAVRKIREKSQVPLILFTYFNPIHSYGSDKFFDDASAAGADGILLLDLPPEEDSVQLNTKGMKRVGLVAPTTPAERAKRIIASSSGFVYYVSREGVTGMQKAVAVEVSDKVAALKKMCPLPVCVGFGISNPEQARKVAGLADGVVVGSALVNEIAMAGKDADLLAKIESFARPLAEAVHNP